MARLWLFDSTNRSWLRSDFLINLDSGVGPSQPNQRGDVLVVQFFLEALRPQWGGSAMVKQDGNVDPTTTSSIRGFQKYVLDRFKYAIPGDSDSVVNPIDWNVYAYTLGWMHTEYVFHFPNF